MHSRFQKSVQKIAENNEILEYSLDGVFATVSFVSSTLQNIANGRDTVSAETLSALKKILRFCCDILCSTEF